MKKILCLLTLIITLSSCSYRKTSPSNGLPDIGVPIEEINTRVRLSAPEGLNTFKIGDEVSLAVEVLSDDQVAYAHDYGARIFINQSNHWVEIENYKDYQQGYIVLDPAKGDAFKLGLAVVNPRLPDQIEAATLRIVLVGNLYRDKQISDTETAAYIDVHLNK